VGGATTGGTVVEDGDVVEGATEVVVEDGDVVVECGTGEALADANTNTRTRTKRFFRKASRNGSALIWTLERQPPRQPQRGSLEP
jgi:hypothetical protein